MADNEVGLKLTADTASATKSIDKFSKDAVKDVSAVEKAFDTLKKVAAGVVIFAGIKKAIDAASEADAAVQRLNIALASTGEFSKEASQEFQDYASELQNLTGISDEAVLGAVSLAKTFGITNEQAKELTSAAIDLSAATGKDLDSAVQQLGATYSGSVGKLAKLGSEFKNLTEAQAKNGEAIKLVRERFVGTAEAMSNTFSGAVAKANNAIGDVFENLGKVITQNPAVIISINEVAKAFNSIAAGAAENQGGLSGGLNSILGPLSKGFAGATAIAQLLVDGVKAVVLGVGALGVVVGDIINAALKPFTFTLGILERAFRAVLGSVDAFLGGLVTFISVIPGAQTAISKLGIDVTKLGKVLAEDAKKNFAIAAGSAENLGDVLDQYLNKEAQKSASAFVDATEDINKELDKVNNVLDIFGVGAASASIQISNLKENVIDTTKGIKNLAKTTEKDISALLDAVKGSFDKLKNSLEQINEENLKKTKTEKELINLEYEKQTQLVANAAEELRLLGKTSKETDAIIEKYKQAIQAKKDLATQSFGGSFIELNPAFRTGIIDAFGEAGKEAVRIIEGVPLKDIISNALGAINAALSATDQKGRFNSIGTIIGSVFDKFLPGIGAVLGQFLGLLSNQSKEQVRESIRAYIDAVPDFVLAIADNLPAIVEGLVDVFTNPKFWERAAKAWINLVLSFYVRFFYEFYKGVAKLFGINLEESGRKFVDGLVKFGQNFASLFSNFGEVFSNLFKNIGPQIADGVRGLLNNIGGPFGDALRSVTEPFLKGFNGLKDIFQPLIDAVNSVADVVKSATGQKGGSGLISEGAQNVGDVLTGKKKVFSKGGMVYASDGYFKPIGTDTVPAMLTPGELVVPRDMVGQLGQFLDNNGGKSEAILMAILNAVQQPVSVQSEVKVNQSAFAEIFLQLNRQNARLSA